MASSYNTVPTEDAPKKKPWKGAVAGVAAASFMLGVLAVTAVRTTRRAADGRPAHEAAHDEARTDAAEREEALEGHVLVAGRLDELAHGLALQPVGDRHILRETAGSHQPEEIGRQTSRGRRDRSDAKHCHGQRLHYMPAAAIGQTSKHLISNEPIGELNDYYTVTLPAHGYAFLGDMRTEKWTSQGYKNCYEGAGASSGSDGDPVPNGPMTIAACFDKCLENDDCQGVTVEWGANGAVECYRREGIDIDNCDDGNTGETWYTTFTRD